MANDLIGLRVVVTRPRAQAGELSRLLSARGALVVVRSTIEVVLRADAPTVAKLAAIDKTTTDAVIITSGNAALALATHATAAARDVPIFAVGSATADTLRRHGFGDVRVGMVASGEGLLDYMRGTIGDRLAGMRLIAPQSSRARDTLVRGLMASRAEVDVVVAYDTVSVSDGPPLPAERIDWVTFTSPSAVEGFVSALTLPDGARVAVLGATTRDAARNHGLPIDAMAATASLDGLVNAIAAEHTRP